MLRRMLQRFLLAMCLIIVMTNVSAQSPSYPKITSDNVHQVTAIRQFGYGAIIDIAFSPDGRYFAVGASTGVVLYDTGDFSENPRFFEGGSGNIAFSPDSSLLAARNHLWDIATGELLYEYDGYSPAFSSDGSHLIYASGQEIISRNMETWQEVLRQTIGEDISEIYLNTDDVTVAIDIPGDLIVWSLEIGKQTIKLETPQYPTILSGETVFSPDGTLLLHAGFDGYVLWDVATGAIRRASDSWLNPSLYAAAFSPDGKQIAIGDASAWINRYDTATGQLLMNFSHDDEVRRVAFNPDATLLAAAASNGIIYIWNISTGDTYAKLTGYSNRAEVIGFDDTDSILSVASIGGTAWQWDVETGKQISVAQGYKFYVSHGTVPYPNTIELNENGNLLATGSVIDGNIHLWTPKGRSRGNLEIGGGLDVVDVAFTADSSIIAAISFSNVFIWDLETGARITGLRVDDRFTRNIAFSPDGNALAIGDASGLTTLQDRASARFIAEFQGPDCDVENLTFSPDGAMIVFTNNCWLRSPEEYDYAIRLWESNTGELLHTLDGHTNNVIGLKFSPDGSILASIARDGTLRFWNPTTGAELASLDAYASAFAFGNDGSIVATSSNNGVIQLWAINQ